MTELAQRLIQENIEKHRRGEDASYLELSRCGLTEMPDLSALHWLETLVVSDSWWDSASGDRIFSENREGRNRLTIVAADSIPENIKRLVLEGGAGENQYKISNFDFLLNKPRLTDLNLGLNQISDGRFLEKLSGLTTLYLSGNQISDWRFLEKLSGLTTLDLSGNPISYWRFLEKLSGLTTLNLRNNQISDGRFLEKLSGLTTLYLRNNRISDLSFLQNLKNLQTLDVSKNQVEDLLPALLLVEKGIPVVWGYLESNKICVQDNPLQNPPVEVVQQGSEAVLRYFEKFRNKTAAEIRYVDEAKVLLIGQPRAGKTTLRHKLRTADAEMPPEEETTRGIDIEPLHFTFQDDQGRERSFKYNVWDFGGQEIYHATHRFFLTSRSIYVAVVNTDVNDKQNDLDYWLHIVELLGGDSPILMVQNQRNKREIKVSKNLKERFAHLLKKEYVLDLKCLKNGEATFDAKRLKDFRDFEEDLQVLLKRLPQTSIPVTQEELAVREAIAELSKTVPVISKERFFEICEGNGLTDPLLQQDFLTLLHELGVLLHFKKNEHLERVVILQNKWATDAVFKILDAPAITRQQGYFDKNDSEQIWNSPDYQGKAVELRALMREFKLCYQIGETEGFIAPQLLPANPPDGYPWQAGSDDLRMVVEYEFMPRGIMTQFIVGMHRDIAEGQRLVWQTGFRVEPKDLPGTRAEASESYDSRRVELKVQGPYAGLLLQRLVDELRKIHDTYQNLEPDELLPCVCEKCQALAPAERHHFKYRSLLNSLYVNRVAEKQCDKFDLAVPIERILGRAGFGKQKQDLDARRLLSEQREFRKGDEPVPVPEAENVPPLAFFSYSKEDDAHLKTFKKYLRTLERSGKIRLWDDLQIRPGEEWDDEIKRNLAASNIIFLLVSVDFLNTDYVWQHEISEAMRRHEAGEVKVIPIRIRKCPWTGTPFSKLQGLPRKDKIISTAPDLDSIWTEVVEEIEKEISR